MSPKERLPALDLLRFVAIFLVIGTHMDDFFGQGYGPGVDAIWLVWEGPGWIGVDLFFVLSGFLVSGLLFSEHKKHGSIRFKRFFIRRGFKIYPAFYVFIAITGIVELVRNTFEGNKYLAEIFFLQSYLPRVWGHTWSLAIEEHFYLLLPLILSLVRPRLVPVICVLMSVLVMFIRLDMVSIVVHMPLDEYIAGIDTFKTHLRIDALFFGTFISYFYHFTPERLDFVRKGWWYFLPIACILLTTPFMSLPPAVKFVLEFPALYLGFGIILILAVSSAALESFSAAKAGRLIAYIGTFSYSLYLWHIPVKYTLAWFLRGGDEIGTPTLTENAVYVVLSFVVGIGFAKAIEIPMLKLRDRLFPAQ